jgi:hypothetical protein
MMTALWTFESQAKLEEFVAVLQKHDIAYEIAAKGEARKPANEVTVSVEERDLEKARRFLLRYKRRKASRDSR